MRLLLCIIFIILLGCKENSHSGNGIIMKSSINELDLIDNIYLDEWIDSIQYVKLETNDSCLIGDITQALYVANKWVIFDYTSQSIFLYDKYGAFIRKVGNRGRGPEEYLKTSNIMVNNITGEILVYCYLTNRLLYFTNEGIFRKCTQFKRPNSAPIRNTALINNGNIICYSYDYSYHEIGENGSGVWEMDSLGNFIKSYFTQETLYPAVHNLTSPYITTTGNYNENVYIRDAIFSNLYCISNNKLDTIILYEYDNPEYLSYAGKTLYDGKGWYIPVSNCAMNTNNWIFNYWDDISENLFISLYNKNNTQIQFTKSWTLNSNGITTIIPNSLPTISNITNAIVFIASYKSPKNIESYKTPIDSTLHQLLNSMNEDDNPILQIAYTK